MSRLCVLLVAEQLTPSDGPPRTGYVTTTPAVPTAPCPSHLPPLRVQKRGCVKRRGKEQTILAHSYLRTKSSQYRMRFLHIKVQFDLHTFCKR